jgi:hypothetical protein
VSTQTRQHVDRSVFHESQTNQVSLNTQLEFGFNLSPTGQPWRDCWRPSPCSKPTPQPCLSGGETSAEAEKEDPYEKRKREREGEREREIRRDKKIGRTRKAREQKGKLRTEASSSGGRARSSSQGHLQNK